MQEMSPIVSLTPDDDSSSQQQWQQQQQQQQHKLQLTPPEHQLAGHKSKSIGTNLTEQTASASLSSSTSDSCDEMREESSGDDDDASSGGGAPPSAEARLEETETAYDGSTSFGGAVSFSGGPGGSSSETGDGRTSPPAVPGIAISEIAVDKTNADGGAAGGDAKGNEDEQQACFVQFALSMLEDCRNSNEYDYDDAAGTQKSCAVASSVRSNVSVGSDRISIVSESHLLMMKKAKKQSVRIESRKDTEVEVAAADGADNTDADGSWITSSKSLCEPRQARPPPKSRPARISTREVEEKVREVEKPKRKRFGGASVKTLFSRKKGQKSKKQLHGVEGPAGAKTGKDEETTDASYQTYDEDEHLFGRQELLQSSRALSGLQPTPSRRDLKRSGSGSAEEKRTKGLFTRVKHKLKKGSSSSKKKDSKSSGKTAGGPDFDPALDMTRTSAPASESPDRRGGRGAAERGPRRGGGSGGSGGVRHPTPSRREGAAPREARERGKRDGPEGRRLAPLGLEEDAPISTFIPTQGSARLRVRSSRRSMDDIPERPGPAAPKEEDEVLVGMNGREGLPEADKLPTEARSITPLRSNVREQANGQEKEDCESRREDKGSGLSPGKIIEVVTVAQST